MFFLTTIIANSFVYNYIVLDHMEIGILIGSKKLYSSVPEYKILTSTHNPKDLVSLYIQMYIYLYY